MGSGMSVTLRPYLAQVRPLGNWSEPPPEINNE